MRPPKHVRMWSVAVPVVGLVAALLAGPVGGLPLTSVEAAPATSPRSCAAPALQTGVDTVLREVEGFTVDQIRVVHEIARAGRREEAPVRAQAIAVMAAWSSAGETFPSSVDGDLFRPSTGADDELGLRDFFSALLAVPGWESLPPSIAAHRALRDGDPFRHELFWADAVGLLSWLVAEGPTDLNPAVAPGARAPAACRPTGDVVVHPLPAGTAYRPSGSGRSATFSAHCGLPVRAPIDGNVVSTGQDGSEAELGRIGVHNERLKTTIWLSHTQRASVSDGQTVTAGTQVAEVGDFGADRCSLGFEVQTSSADDGGAVDAAGWLQTNLGTSTAADKTRKVTQKRDDTSTEPAIPATTTRVATFNVLGAHHSAPGGKNARLADGAFRMRSGLNLIEASGVEIVAFQEFEGPQAGVVRGDPDWELFRATGNSRLRGGDVSGNAIAWRSAVWKLVDGTEFTVPWQVTLHMPVVTLQHRETGREIVVIGVHNPASTKRQGNQQGARNVARGIERSAVARYRAETDDPVVLVGDMNERATVYCDFTRDGFMQAAAGVSGAGCTRPPYGGVDWIFGAGTLTFAGHTVNRSTLGRISDHPLVSAQLLIPGD